jgi:hypothetical protein
MIGSRGAASSGGANVLAEDSLVGDGDDAALDLLASGSAVADEIFGLGRESSRWVMG